MEDLFCLGVLLSFWTLMVLYLEVRGRFEREPKHGSSIGH